MNKLLTVALLLASAFTCPLTCATPVAAAPKTITLGEYLLSHIPALQAYYTVENLQSDNYVGVEGLQVVDQPAKSLNDVAKYLNSQVSGATFTVDPQFPNVLHCVSGLLSGGKSNGFSENASVIFTGTRRSLVALVAQDTGVSVSCSTSVVISSIFYDGGDMQTTVNAKHEPIRQILTDACSPFKEVNHELWVAETTVSNGVTSTNVQFF